MIYSNNEIELLKDLRINQGLVGLRLVNKFRKTYSNRTYKGILHKITDLRLVGAR